MNILKESGTGLWCKKGELVEFNFDHLKIKLGKNNEVH